MLGQEKSLGIFLAPFFFYTITDDAYQFEATLH